MGGLVGLGAGAIPLVAHVGAFGLYALVAGVAGATGALAGVVSARERLRRADSHAQQTRVHALERNLSLRESHEGGVGARLEGSVAAGQYRILRRMGSGATGVIYEAVRISDGQRVAIKLLRVAAAHDAVASDRLRREAEALGPVVAPQRRRGHRSRAPAGRHGVPRDGALARRVARHPPEQPRAPHAARPPADLAADVRRARRRARRGRGPPGREAVEYPPRRRSRRSRPGPSASSCSTSGSRASSGKRRASPTRAARSARPATCRPSRRWGRARSTGGATSSRSARSCTSAWSASRRRPGLRAGSFAWRASSPRLDSGTQRAAAFLPPNWRAVIDKAMALQPADRYVDARAFAQALRPFEKTSSRPRPRIRAVPGRYTTRSDLPAMTSLWLPIR